MIGRFGKTLSETFFRSYVEKLYGRPWNEIDPEFAWALTASGPHSSTRATFPYPSRGPARSATVWPARSLRRAGRSARAARPSGSTSRRPRRSRRTGASSRTTTSSRRCRRVSLPDALPARRRPSGRPRRISRHAARCSCISTSTAASASPSCGGTCTTRGIAWVGSPTSHAGGRPARRGPAPPNRTVLCTEFWCTRDDRDVARVGRRPRARLRTGTARVQHPPRDGAGRRRARPSRRGHASGTERRHDYARPELGQLLRDLRPSRCRRSPCRPRYERHRRQPAGRCGGRLEGRRGMSTRVT